MKKEVIICGIIFALLAAWYFIEYKPKMDKKKIIDQIMAKYNDPKSPSYQKSFEGTPQSLALLDIRDLRRILDDSHADLKYTDPAKLKNIAG